MASLTALQQRVLDNLYANNHQARPKLQRLDGAVASQTTDTTVTVEDGTAFVVEDVLEFEDGEQGLVWGIATNDLTVVRQHNGTTAAAHADNEFVKINPVHTRQEITDALNEALRDMDRQGVYQLAAATDITLVAGQDTYEITETDFRNPEGVRALFYKQTTTLDLIGLPYRNIFDPFSQDLTQDMAIQILSWGEKSAGSTLSVIYAQDITALIDGGLTDAAIEDAAVLYATGKMIEGMEGPRLHDPGRYTDRTVQPGANVRTGAFYMAQYQRQVWKIKAALKKTENQLPRHPDQKRLLNYVR